MTGVSLRVSVPFCSFRKPYAREFLESERLPPPSTVYGFLLSFVGEENRRVHIGTRIAIAVCRKPEVSLLLRTAWRTKDKKVQPGMGSNKRPDYQEVLSGLEIAVWVRNGPLAERLGIVRDSPSEIDRFGGLSLGESRDLVDEVCFYPDWANGVGRWLCQDTNGEYPLPVWVDHVGSKGTRWTQFRLRDAPLEEPPAGDPRWITIQPPDP